MAFSIRRMFSNINYFKKSEDGDCPDNASTDTKNYAETNEAFININFDCTEPDSTSKQCATSLILPESVKSFGIKKGSLSDTDVIAMKKSPCLKDKRKTKKLRLDIKKANKVCSESIDCSDNDSSNNVENTPKHVLLESQSVNLFRERLKNFDFNQSFDICDVMSDTSSSTSQEDQIDLESLSDHSETDISLQSNEHAVKMCRKVEQNEIPANNQMIRTTSLDSFGDVELDKNEEERIKLLLNYQMKLEKLECFLSKLLTEFQFHIEVSKIFQCRSIVTPLPGTDVANVPKIMGHMRLVDNVSRGVSPTSSWNIVIENEDRQTKLKLKKQLVSMRQMIDQFINSHLQKDVDNKPKEMQCSTYNMHDEKHVPKKRLRISLKKKIKHFDFPDFSDAMTNLFEPKLESSLTEKNTINLISDDDESNNGKCICKCHCTSSVLTNDSGLTSKTNEASNMSITSSIGNFSLDSTTLSAYSESLDQIVSYNSFEDSSLYNTLLQKSAMERITFYVQVHSIQLKCEQNDNYESKNTIIFHCPSCKTVEKEENGLLKHILSQRHCENIHFIYKTAYVKKCIADGKEIQPSTVLNPMKMYRDDNKIVCFGDAVYACSLCFENMIVGESVLMAHCSDPEHADRRDRLGDILN